MPLNMNVHLKEQKKWINFTHARQFVEKFRDWRNIDYLEQEQDMYLKDINNIDNMQAVAC